MNNELAIQYEYMNKCRELVDKISEKKGRPLSMCISTFGCQMNAKDSEKLKGILLNIGFVDSDSEDADFVLYNTCTVRENANQKVYGHLGQLKKAKKSNPDMLVALCGCMMQEPDVVEKIRKSYPIVDIVFGTHNIYKLAELLYKRLSEGKRVIEVLEAADKIVEELPAERKYSFKSGVNIMFGCNNFCSYCIVPYVRGRERSRKSEDIIKEIETLAAEGVVEIMLLGQNVNSYGKGLDEDINFSELLRRVCRVDGIERVRFMTSHPKDLSDELIEVMAENPKICNHIHLPLQSGSSRLLDIMNRHYTKEDYLLLVKKIRAVVPDISITTDIIVGFPGETEEDFLETLDVVRESKFDSAFTFIYSRRTGTPAAKMENQVPEDVIKERFDRLLKEVSAISSAEAGRYVGKTLPLLIEGVNEQDSSFVSGRLTNNMIVHVPGDASLIGKIVNVNIKESKGFYYFGELIEV